MNRREYILAAGAIGTTTVAGCSRGADGAPTDSPAATLEGSPTIASPAFEDGSAIPERYTCEGADVSPPLSISGVPDTAVSLALVVDDPDAPNPPFSHWLIWSVDPETTTIPAEVPRGKSVEALGAAIQGTNDQGRVGSGGPCPPPADSPHTYRFRLLALGEALDLDAGSNRAAFDEAVTAIPRARAVLTGTFDR